MFDPTDAQLRPIRREMDLRAKAFRELERQVEALELLLLQNQPIAVLPVLALGWHLQAVPCTATDFSRVTNRVRNVLRYLRSGEAGAARYELLLLLKQLRHWGQDV